MWLKHNNNNKILKSEMLTVFVNIVIRLLYNKKLYYRDNNCYYKHFKIVHFIKTLVNK